MAFRKPASKIVCARLGPTAQMRLGHVSHVAGDNPSNPKDPFRNIAGKNAVWATPICALASATARSPAAMSGRLSRSSDGKPAGTDGDARLLVVSTAMEKVEAG